MVKHGQIKMEIRSNSHSKIVFVNIYIHKIAVTNPARSNFLSKSSNLVKILNHEINAKPFKIYKFTCNHSHQIRILIKHRCRRQGRKCHCRACLLYRNPRQGVQRPVERWGLLAFEESFLDDEPVRELPPR